MGGILDQTYAVINSLQQASTPDQICSRLTEFTGDFGLTAMLAGTSPPRGNKTDEASHLFAWSYPVEWMERYLERRYALIDPIIRRIETDLTPFYWESARPFAQPDQIDEVDRLMNEAAEFKLKNGIVVPLLTLDGGVAAVSLGGERVEIPPNAGGMLNLVSSFAMARAIELRTVEAAQLEVGLTPREVECLKWLADGKSEWEIGVILRISEHTADKHLSNARRKLKAVSGAQAIARAIRLGFLS